MAIVLFGVVIFAFVAYSLRYTSVVLALALCMFGFEQVLQSQSSYFVVRGALVNIVVGLVILAATFWTLVNHTGKITIPTSYWWTMALFGYAYSTFWWLSDYQGTWHYEEWISNLPYLATVLFMGALLVQDARGLRIALTVTLVFALALSMYMAFIGNWSGRGLELTNAGRQQIASSVLALAQIGGYVAVIASLLRFEQLKFWWLIKWAIVGLGLYVTFQTASRGQTIALVATVLVCTPISDGKLSRKSVVNGIIALGAIAICLYVVLPMVDTARWRQASVESSVNFRMSMMESLWNAYTHSSFLNWAFGLGASAAYAIVGFYIHNVPVEVLCEEGLLGFTLFMIALGIPVRRFYQIVTQPVRNLQDQRERNTLVVVFALLLFEFMLQNKQGSLYSGQNLFLFAIILQGRAEQMLAQRNVTQSGAKRVAKNTERKVAGAI